MAGLPITDMIRHGEREHKRLRDKIKEKLKKNLKQYISDESFIGRQGKKFVRVPIYGLRLPRFVVDPRKRGGVGQGDGEEGQPLPGQGQPQQGKPGKGKKAGNEAGEHVIEVDVNLDEMLDLLSEALELPNIEEKGKTRRIISKRIHYNNLRKVGPEATLDVRRTLKNAIIRNIIEGNFDPEKDEFPEINIQKDDKRHKVWDVEEQRSASAVIIAMMDVSGSMGDEQKEVVRTEMFWLESWLKRQYDDLEIIYIVHDTQAQIVPHDVFYSLSEGGGTNISSAYKTCAELIATAYSPREWNIYPFHFSDGDNWSSEDDALCIKLLNEWILPHCNQFSYVQVKSRWGSGKFKDTLHSKLSDEQKKRLVISLVEDKDGILDSIRELLGKGN
jgi:sporulation protein YhbH